MNRTETLLIVFIIADLIVDLISLLITAGGWRYFAGRTVPTPDLALQESLDRERKLVDELRRKIADGESSIRLVSHNRDRLRADNAKLQERLNKYERSEGDTPE